MGLINENIEITKSNETKEAYLDRTLALFKRFTKESNKDAKTNLHEFIDWMVGLKPSIGPSTWRQYKSSIVWFLESRSENSLALTLKETKNDGCKNIRRLSMEQRKTSSKKKKSITEREEELIVKHLELTASESFWAKPTLAFFNAMLLTGLRPDEWQNAVLFTKNAEDICSLELPVLKVKNAKSTNERSHGEYRHLGLSSLTKAELIYIRIAIQYANGQSPQGWITQEGKVDNYHTYYKFIRSHLYRTTTKLFPTATRRVTPYSCRHQFIANLKKAKYSREEIAALVGHATDETATVHYGRTKFGRSRSGLPKADPSEVKKIRNIYKGRPAHAVGPAPSEG